jgi:hypothetical protein
MTAPMSKVNPQAAMFGSTTIVYYHHQERRHVHQVSSSRMRPHPSSDDQERGALQIVRLCK